VASLPRCFGNKLESIEAHSMSHLAFRKAMIAQHDVSSANLFTSRFCFRSSRVPFDRFLRDNRAAVARTIYEHSIPPRDFDKSTTSAILNLQLLWLKTPTPPTPFTYILKLYKCLRVTQTSRTRQKWMTWRTQAIIERTLSKVDITRSR